MVFGVKMGSELHLPLYCGYFPLYVVAIFHYMLTCLLVYTADLR